MIEHDPHSSTHYPRVPRTMREAWPDPKRDWFEGPEADPPRSSIWLLLLAAGVAGFIAGLLVSVVMK